MQTNVNLPLKPQSCVWFYHLIVGVHWVSFTWTLVSCGVHAEWYSGTCMGLDGKEFENYKSRLLPEKS